MWAGVQSGVVLAEALAVRSVATARYAALSLITIIVVARYADHAAFRVKALDRADKRRRCVYLATSDSVQGLQTGGIGF